MRYLKSWLRYPSLGISLPRLGLWKISESGLMGSGGAVREYIWWAFSNLNACRLHTQSQYMLSVISNLNTYSRLYLSLSSPILIHWISIPFLYSCETTLPREIRQYPLLKHWGPHPPGLWLILLLLLRICFCLLFYLENFIMCSIGYCCISTSIK